MSDKYYGGLDFGTSGAKISIINSKKELIYKGSINYKYGFIKPQSWINSCIELLKGIPNHIKYKLIKLSISGTSGTLVPCKSNGINIGDSIPYNQICNENVDKLKLIAGEDPFLNNPFSSLAKALKLIDFYGDNIILRHQSDWISGWLINDWRFGEASNNIKLGWNIEKESWPKLFNSFSLRKYLPKIVKSGNILGKIRISLAKEIDLNKNLTIIAGTTDSNAAFISSQINSNEGLTILGTTIVLKKTIKQPINYAGITSHKINGEWICGGSSNAGCGVLSKFFCDEEIEELSRQINPLKKTNLNFLPLNSKGERFPINDPQLEPIVDPRPVSDALFLHGLLEGLANIELKGWEKLQNITGSYPDKIVTIGGGSRNPQWRSIRERILKIPVVTCDKTTSFGTALIALNANL